MKERPILFSAPMISAILDGRKTMTRRVVKDPLAKNGGQYCVEHADDDPNFLVHVHNPKCEGYCDYACHYPCPFGQPGHRLWVRETFRVAAWRDAEMKVACDYKASPKKTHTPWIFLPYDTYEAIQYRQLIELFGLGIRPDSDGQYLWEHGKAPVRWRPSIHMPRWASRLTLLVKAVRVERLQEISEEDAMAEGIERDGNKGFVCPDSHFSSCRTTHPVSAFASLWQSLNAKRPGCSWEDNPWVWVVEFETIEAPL